MLLMGIVAIIDDPSGGTRSGIVNRAKDLFFRGFERDSSSLGGWVNKTR
jgi:hypothetical protein